MENSNKDSFNASIKMIDGSVLDGRVVYLPSNRYMFISNHDKDFGFKFHHDLLMGFMCDAYHPDFNIIDAYMQQLFEQIAINDMPSE